MEILASIAAIVAAMAVGWQALETRRATQSSQDSLKVASEGLATAVTALEVARQEESHSRELVAETIRARLDAALPEISVLPTPSIFDVQVLHRGVGETEWRPCSEETRWSLPAERNAVLSFWCSATVHNSSSRVVRIGVDMTENVGEQRVFGSRVVPSGQSLMLEFVVAARIATWAVGGTESEEFRAGAFSDDGGARPPSFWYSDDREVGARISWEFQISAPPVHEHDHDRRPGQFALVTVPSYLNLSGPAQPELTVTEKRGYWISKSKGTLLDESA